MVRALSGRGPRWAGMEGVDRVTRASGDRKWRSMRCGSSAPRHSTSESGSLCGRGLFDNRAIHRRNRRPRAMAPA